MSAILALAALSTLQLQASGAFGNHAAIAAPPAPAPNALALPPKTVDDSVKPVMTALSREFVFQAGDCDVDGKCYVDFRIPALKRTKSGALIAFAEASGAARNIANGILDHGIVARISADGSGHSSSWGKIFKVAYTYPEANESFGNPSPVVDLKTGTIFLHLCRGQEGIDADFAALITASTDGGHTWGARTSLNATLKVPGTGWYAPGPGGGTQLPTGRMITLVEERPIAKTRTAFNAVPIYSDDGKSWDRAAYVPVLDNRSHGCGEPSVSLLGNSSVDLVMVCRGAKAPIAGFSTSSDGGTTWRETKLLSEIPSPGCQHSISGMHGGVGALITSPTCPNATCIAQGTRADLQLFHASATSGFKDWSSLGTLDPGLAGYSSLLPATPLTEDGAARSRSTDVTCNYLVLYESMNYGARCTKIGQRRCSDVALITFALKTNDAAATK
jgi:sialidase-1|eukprot:COSAG02_NODE_616_length_19505_cov_5.004998_1_plen_446_part_00